MGDKGTTSGEELLKFNDAPQVVGELGLNWPQMLYETNSTTSAASWATTASLQKLERRCLAQQLEQCRQLSDSVQ